MRSEEVSLEGPGGRGYDGCVGCIGEWSVSPHLHASFFPCHRLDSVGACCLLCFHLKWLIASCVSFPPALLSLLSLFLSLPTAVWTPFVVI